MTIYTVDVEPGRFYARPIWLIPKAYPGEAILKPSKSGSMIFCRRDHRRQQSKSASTV